MLTIKFECDLCGKTEVNELKYGYAMPVYKEFDICVYCHCDAVRALILKKKGRPLDCTCENISPNYMHFKNCPSVVEGSV